MRNIDESYKSLVSTLRGRKDLTVTVTSVTEVGHAFKEEFEKGKDEIE